ncbi:unnamed protein product [Ectocarpus sp. 8 AP-2014]
MPRFNCHVPWILQHSRSAGRHLRRLATCATSTYKIRGKTLSTTLTFFLLCCVFYTVSCRRPVLTGVVSPMHV